jgi:hypothetical protein
MIAAPKDFLVVVGKKPWKVWKGFGSFLLFEFGTKHKDPNGKIFGSYTLWIYMAAWRICYSKDELAHSESPDSKIERAAAALSGKKLQAIRLNTVMVPRRVRYAACFYFEEKHRLDVYQYERTKRDTIFMLYTPRSVISYDNDGAIQSKNLINSRRQTKAKTSKNLA